MVNIPLAVAPKQEAFSEHPLCHLDSHLQYDGGLNGCVMHGGPTGGHNGDPSGCSSQHHISWSASIQHLPKGPVSVHWLHSSAELMVSTWPSGPTRIGVPTAFTQSFIEFHPKASLKVSQYRIYGRPFGPIPSGHPHDEELLQSCSLLYGPLLTATDGFCCQLLP